LHIFHNYFVTNITTPLRFFFHRFEFFESLLSRYNTEKRSFSSPSGSDKKEKDKIKIKRGSNIFSPKPQSRKTSLTSFSTALSGRGVLVKLRHKKIRKVRLFFSAGTRTKK
jgi:hypothetical protein